jgi:hypothetical protein
MKVVITSPVEHDGKSLAEGDTADMPETQAQALIDAGVAVAVGRKARSAKTDEQLAAEAAAAAADDAARAQAAALAAKEGQGA